MSISTSRTPAVQTSKRKRPWYIDQRVMGPRYRAEVKASLPSGASCSGLRKRLRTKLRSLWDVMPTAEREQYLEHEKENIPIMNTSVR